MEEKLELNYHRYPKLGSLPQEIQNLFSEAFKIRKSAYAPYSGFKVGCAIALENGAIVTGNNQENASYPVSICAERTALSTVHSLYPDISIQTVVIVAGKNMQNDIPIAPCGMCRQSLLEYEEKQNNTIEVYFMGTIGNIIKFNSIKDLLPFYFTKNVL